jgi:hypothetical protein
MSKALRILSIELFFGVTLLDVIDYLFLFIEKIIILKDNFNWFFASITTHIENSIMISQYLDLINSNRIFKKVLKLYYRFRFVIQCLLFYAFLISIVTRISRFFMLAFEFLLYLPINIVICSFKIISSLLYRIISFILVNPKYIILSSSILSLFLISISIVCFVNKVTEMKQTFEEKRAISKLKLSTLLKIKFKLRKIRKNLKKKKALKND